MWSKRLIYTAFRGIFYSLEYNAKSVQHIGIVEKTTLYKKLSTDFQGPHFSLTLSV